MQAPPVDTMCAVSNQPKDIPSWHAPIPLFLLPFSLRGGFVCSSHLTDI